MVSKSSKKNMKQVSSKETIEKEEKIIKPKTNKKQFNKENVFGILKKATPFIFILFVMWFAFFIRSGPINLDGLDERIEASTYSQIQSLITQQVEQQYPNLNSAYKQELVDKEFQKVIETGTFQGININDLIQQNTETIKARFKADDNNQTYLNAIDPYHFLQLSENYQKNGHTGTEIINEESIVTYKIAPENSYKGSFNPQLQIWLEEKLFKLNGLSYDSPIGEKTKAIYLIPVIFAMLSVIPIFLIIRRFSNDLFALFGSLILVSIGTFVSRTIAGFVDTDAYNVFFPLLISMFIIYGFIYENKILTATFAILAGLSQGLFMWAWGQAWFMFIFIIISLIGYVGYLFIINILNKEKISKISFDLINDLIILISFIFSSYIFTYLFARIDLFETLFNRIINILSGGLKSANVGNIWPNVLSSVAELNAASFSSIISSVGGKIVFVIAMLGITFLTINKLIKTDKYKFISNIFLSISLIWYLAIIFGNLFVNLTANLPFSFLLLLFFPVIIGFIINIIGKIKDNNFFLVILLSVWMAGTIYMSLIGVRFILLLGPAFAISFAIGLYHLSEIINNFFNVEFKIKNEFKRKIGGILTVSILFLVLFSPLYTQANAISKGTTPNFDDVWYSSMEKIKQNSSEDAIITSWWDFGHFFAAVADRGVTFDGGSQTTPQAHWVGKLFMENDEKVSQDILRMLVCGGNKAFEYMLNETQDKTGGVLINKILYKTFGEDISKTRQILENNEYFNFSEEQINKIMSYLACETPRENFLITSEDMVGKAGVWTHWGSWDFTKKYVHDNYKLKSAQEIANDIDENETLIQTYIDQLKEIDVKSNTQNIKRENLINQWLAPYPSYIPIQGRYQFPCLENNMTLTCQNGVIINLITGKIDERSLNGQLQFKNLIYPTQDNKLEVVEQDTNGNIDVLLIPANGNYNVMLMQTPLGASLFTKLFYLNGYGTEMFEKFDDVQSATGVRVITWKTKWNSNEENIDNILDDVFINETSIPELLE